MDCSWLAKVVVVMTAAQWALDLTALLASATADTATFAALATVRVDGTAAANRTVVVRGLLDVDGVHDGIELVAGEGVCLVAHRESDKVAEARQPGRWAELCWFVPSAWQQFRIAGPVAVLDEHVVAAQSGGGTGALAQARSAAWSALSTATRAMFAWPAPGLPLDENAATSTKAQADVAAEQPPAAFALLVLAPRRVDWLHLRVPGPHQRAVETRNETDGTWHRRNVTP